MEERSVADGAHPNAIGPVVVCVRGRSRSGKTALIERLIPLMAARGVRTAYVKRTHHELDLPEKASGRVWRAEPAAMAIQTPERLQFTVPRNDLAVAELIGSIPGDVDLVLLETHSHEAYPTILSCDLEPEPGEVVIGRWAFGAADMAAAGVAPRLAKLLPADRELDHALRAAMRAHGGHACAGLVLGTRLAIAGAAALGVAVPDTKKRLLVAAETDRCAVDAIQSVTGCRPGKRTLRLLDYGKLAATFIDEWSGVAVRVAARGDLRERVGEAPDGIDRHDHQREAYLSMTTAELFTVTPADASVAQMDLPGSPKRRVLCTACGEEVSDGRDVATESGPLCKPCAAPGAGAIPLSGEQPC